MQAGKYTATGSAVDRGRRLAPALRKVGPVQGDLVCAKDRAAKPGCPVHDRGRRGFGDRKGNPTDACDCAPVPRCGLPDGLFDGARVLVSKSAHQVCGVDVHRTRELAHAVDRAGVDPVVAVVLPQLGKQGEVTGCFGSRHLPADHDPLPGRHCHVFGRAARFAEAALHTPVDLVLHRRHKLQITNIGGGIVGEHHAGVQHAGRVA